MRITIDDVRKEIELPEDVNLQDFLEWCTKYVTNWSEYKIVQTVKNTYTPYYPTQPIPQQDWQKPWWEQQPVTVSYPDTNTVLENSNVNTTTNNDALSSKTFSGPATYKVDIKAPQNN